MRIVAISDTHGQHRKIDVPGGDVLLHAGDMSAQGRLDTLRDFNEWLENLPHERKLFVAGNHDFCFENEETREEALNVLTAAEYLEDRSVDLDGVRVWGSPWQPEFFDWAFNLPRGEPLKEKWDLIPADIDVLLTHAAPYGTGDVVEGKDRPVGCKELREAVDRVSPRYHFFGHIHEGYGEYQRGSSTLINVSVCNAHYEPINDPVVVDLD